VVTNLTVIPGGEEGGEPKEFVDGDTSAAMLLFRRANEYAKNSPLKVIGAAALIAFDDGSVATLYESDSHHFQLIGGAVALQRRMYDDMSDK